MLGNCYPVGTSSWPNWIMFLQETSENAFKSLRQEFVGFLGSKVCGRIRGLGTFLNIESKKLWNQFCFDCSCRKRNCYLGRCRHRCHVILFFDMRSRWGKRLSQFGGYIQSLKLQSWQLPASQAPRKTMPSNAYILDLRLYTVFRAGTAFLYPKDPCMVYLPTYIYHKKQVNVDKYTIHGSSGI